jgi:hypothetical protein
LWKIKYVDELTLKIAWDLCYEYDICRYWRYAWKYIWMGYDIFELRIVMINGCWNWNVFIVMKVLVKIYVNGLWYIWIENCDDK